MERLPGVFMILFLTAAMLS
jgi:hypothetical protein